MTINLEDLVSARHALWPIERMASMASPATSLTFAAVDAPSDGGERPSVPPQGLLTI